jgi:hypothetical protein
MVLRQASVSKSTASSLSASWTLHDEGSRLCHYLAAPHSVGGTGVSGKKAMKSMRRRQRTKQEKPTTTPTGDNEYHLRWNPTGDYDSDDDDWWNEVMVLERKEQEEVAASAAKQQQNSNEEEALYLGYKYHTTKVMKWGISSWANHYGGKNGEGEVDGDGGENHLPLRTMIGRLNDLALDGFPMPPVIYRNLENAVELREEFQIRIVMERRNQAGGRGIRKTSRRKKNTSKASASSSSLSPSTRNNSSDTGLDDKIGDGAAKNNANNIITKDITTSMTAKTDNHLWILNQLKVLLYRFRTEPNPRRFIVSDIKDGDHCSFVVGTKASFDSENSCCELSSTIPESPDKRPFDNNNSNNNSNNNNRDKNCNESLFLHPSKEDDTASTILSSCMSSPGGNDNRYTGRFSSSSTIDDWDEIFGDDGSLIRSHENSEEDDDATTILSSCISSSSTSVPSPGGDDNRCTGQLSASNSTMDDWEEIFGDDGSLIGSHENRNGCPQTRGVDIVLSIITHQAEDESSSQNLSNPEILKWDGHCGNDKTDPCQNPMMTQKPMSLDSTTLENNVAELSNPFNSSVRRDFPPQRHNKSSTDNNKTKGLLPKAENISDELSDYQKPQRQMIESQTNGTRTFEKPSALKNVIIPATNGTSPERVRYPKQYDSVWDVSFLEEEVATNLKNAVRTPVSTRGVSLPNSDIPEDWEMLLEEEHEEEEETIIEDTRSRMTRKTEETIEIASDTALLPNVHKIELSRREKNGTENKHPNENNNVRQDLPDRVFLKMIKPPYAITTENLRYDSVWDIFSKEKASSAKQIAVNDAATTRSAISIIQNTPPEDDWEALYS